MRRRQHHRVPCEDPDQYLLVSPSDRVEIDVCVTCGFRIKVDGRVIARVRGPFDRDRFLREVERAATCCPAVPAAELRHFTALD